MKKTFEKIISIMLCIAFVISWQGSPSDKKRYLLDYGRYTFEVKDAKRFDKSGEAYSFQDYFRHMYKTRWDKFNMGVWSIEEVN